MDKDGVKVVGSSYRPFTGTLDGGTGGNSRMGGYVDYFRRTAYPGRIENKRHRVWGGNRRKAGKSSPVDGSGTYSKRIISDLSGDKWGSKSCH
jgi:hypothetical protein